MTQLLVLLDGRIRDTKVAVTSLVELFTHGELMEDSDWDSAYPSQWHIDTEFALLEVQHHIEDLQGILLASAQKVAKRSTAC